MDILVEVNIGREENKSGVEPEKLEELLCEISQFEGISVKGLMAIPPICENKHKTPYLYDCIYKNTQKFVKRGCIFILNDVYLTMSTR